MTITSLRSWRTAAALATVLAGVVTIVSSLTRDVAWRDSVLAPVEPWPAHSVAHIVGVLGGLALLILAWGMLRGRRGASHAAPAVLLVVAMVHAAKGLDYEEALMAVGLAAVLRTGMRATASGGRPPRGAIAGVAAVVALGASYSLCLAWVLAHGGALRIDQAVARAASVTWAATGSDATAIAGYAGDLLHALIGLTVLATLLAVRARLAPVRPVDGHDAADHARAAAIVAAHGRCSIAPFVLRADKSYFFAHDGVLAYRTVGETAVVSGDPVGPPGSGPAIVSAFRAFARERGWDVAVMAAGEHDLPAYRALGLRAMRIGSEAVAIPSRFTLEGGAHKTLRKAVNRVHRRGWTVEVLGAADLGDDQVRELAAVESAWRSGQPRLTGFSMAMDRLWGAEEDLRDVYVLGRSPDGRLHGFLRFLPYDAGLSLDAMRRLGGEPNGFNEALIVAGLRHAAEVGYDEVSLNFAGFAHVMASDGPSGPQARLLRAALRLAHGRFQLERLARFNARFDPVWRPRYLVYESLTRLPRAALRVLQAEAYVKCPRAKLRKDAWWPAELPPAGLPAASPGGA